MTMLNNVMTNTIHFSDSVHPSFNSEQTDSKDVNCIIVRIAAQLDLYAVYGTVQ